MLKQAPEELQPKKIWWECACEIKCLCGAAQFVVTDEEDIRCDECGRVWGLMSKLWCTSPVTLADVVKQHLDLATAMEEYVEARLQAEIRGTATETPRGIIGNANG